LSPPANVTPPRATYCRCYPTARSSLKQYDPPPPPPPKGVSPHGKSRSRPARVYFSRTRRVYYNIIHYYAFYIGLSGVGFSVRARVSYYILLFLPKSILSSFCVAFLPPVVAGYRTVIIHNTIHDYILYAQHCIKLCRLPNFARPKPRRRWTLRVSSCESYEFEISTIVEFTRLCSHVRSLILGKPLR